MTNKTVFVFGSNEAGIHGAGAAAEAYKKHGARWGFSYGHIGDSFAIPTKDQEIREALNYYHIKGYVQGFIAYADSHPELTFKVTRIGCGLAGLVDEDIAVLFENAPSNCQFDEKWRPWLGDVRNYWGTF